MRILIAALAGGILSVTGCDPGHDITGLVRDQAGAPIASASVDLRCPIRTYLDRHTSTDSSGRFHLRKIGCLEMACVVSIATNDRNVKQFTVRDSCKKTTFSCPNGCQIVQIDATF